MSKISHQVENEDPHNLLKLTMKDLKVELYSRGLTFTGSKGDLVARLTNSINTSEALSDFNIITGHTINIIVVNGGANDVPPDINTYRSHNEIFADDQATDAIIVNGGAICIPPKINIVTTLDITVANGHATNSTVVNGFSIGIYQNINTPATIDATIIDNLHNLLELILKDIKV